MTRDELEPTIAALLCADRMVRDHEICTPDLAKSAVALAREIFAELDRTAMPHTQAEADEGRSAFGEAMARMAGKSPARAEFERAWKEYGERCIEQAVESERAGTKGRSGISIPAADAVDDALETLARELAGKEAG